MNLQANNLYKKSFSKKQKSKMLATNISDLICFLMWNICSSAGKVLQGWPFSAVFLYLLFQAEMLCACSSGQRMPQNSTAHTHKEAVVDAPCCPLDPIQFFGLCLDAIFQQHSNLRWVRSFSLLWHSWLLLDDKYTIHLYSQGNQGSTLSRLRVATSTRSSKEFAKHL